MQDCDSDLEGYPKTFRLLYKMRANALWQSGEDPLTFFIHGSVSRKVTAF
jgi:spermidine/putrescine-binding protein